MVTNRGCCGGAEHAQPGVWRGGVGVALRRKEVARLRRKFLVWASAHENGRVFDSAATAKIRDGSGHRDAAADLVALCSFPRARG
jgi:hypothetical protein